MADLVDWAAVLAYLAPRSVRVSRTHSIATIDVASPPATIDVASPPGSIAVQLALTRFEQGSFWIGLSVDVCPADRVHLRAGLVANGELPIGALVIRGEVALLRQTIPLDGLTGEQLDATISSLVATGCRLRAAANARDEEYREFPFAYCFRSPDPPG